jgi:hypothetical protein
VRTFLLLSLFSIGGVILFAILNAAYQYAYTALILVMLFGAVAGGISQHKSEIGSKVSWCIWVIFDWNRARWRDYYPIHTSGRVFLGTIAGASVTGIVTAFFILHFNNSFFNLAWLKAWASEYSNQWPVGALFGASIFSFRKILLKYRTFSTWEFDDIYLYKIVTNARTKRKKSPTTPIDLTGVLQECPTCNKKQNVKNSHCSCGEDMIKVQMSGGAKYWIRYYDSGGAERREFIGHSIELAARHAAVKRNKKRE